MYNLKPLPSSMDSEKQKRILWW